MIWLHLYRPAPAALVRCYGSGLLTWALRCNGCEDCGPCDRCGTIGTITIKAPTRSPQLRLPSPPPPENAHTAPAGGSSSAEGGVYGGDGGTVAGSD